MMIVSAKLLHSCLPLWDPIDCSPPVSSVHGNSPDKNTGVYGLRKCSSFILLQVVDQFSQTTC